MVAIEFGVYYFIQIKKRANFKQIGAQLKGLQKIIHHSTGLNTFVRRYPYIDFRPHCAAYLCNGVVRQND